MTAPKIKAASPSFMPESASGEHDEGNASLRIADMSATQIRVLPVRPPRKEQNRLAKQRSREKKAAQGRVTFQIELAGSDAVTVKFLQEAQSGNRETFLARALLVGAKFAYNSGNVRGGKKRIKGAHK